MITVQGSFAARARSSQREEVLDRAADRRPLLPGRAHVGRGGTPPCA